MREIKTVLICGFGISGQAAAKLAIAMGMIPVIADERNTPDHLKVFQELQQKRPEAKAFFNWNGNTPLPPCDLIVVSPGIRKNSALFIAAEKMKNQTTTMLSELEFALKCLKKPFAAITGTNGKTTTTELTTALLQANGVRAESSGNIGTALSECVLRTFTGEIDFLVIETSSFQLENIQTFPPSPAAILNLAGDHIDRHGSMEEYAKTKFRLITETMSPENRIINTSLLPYLKKFLPETAVTLFSANDPSADLTLQNEMICFRNKVLLDTRTTELHGIHNIENMMAALALLRAVKGEMALFSPETAQALRSFRSSPHRVECFAERNGIRYINDSKATNPHAVNAAVQMYGNGKNLHILLGGLDKGMDFHELEVSFPAIRKAYLFGSCRESLQKTLENKVEYELFDSFQEAVYAACSNALSEECVMLSPATASMDMFKNYAERGDKFKEFVLNFLNTH